MSRFVEPERGVNFEPPLVFRPWPDVPGILAARGALKATGNRAAPPLDLDAHGLRRHIPLSPRR